MSAPSQETGRIAEAVPVRTTSSVETTGDRRREECQPRREPCRPARPPRRGRTSCCLAPDEPPDRPDPGLYSQDEQFGLGLEPTWNSPDITTNRWSPWRLMEEMEVDVRNYSATASAVAVAVGVAISPFGIGMPRSPLSTQVVHIDAGHESRLFYPLSQSLLNGPPHIGAHVTITHSLDQRLINNLGSQMIWGVFTSEAGRQLEFSFPVRNPQAGTQQITLAALANDLGAVVTPASRPFTPFEQINAKLTMMVPASLHGAPGADVRREITVVGRDGAGRVIDGLTYIVRIDN